MGISGLQKVSLCGKGEFIYWGYFSFLFRKGKLGVKKPHLKGPTKDSQQQNVVLSPMGRHFVVK